MRLNASALGQAPWGRERGEAALPPARVDARNEHLERPPANAGRPKARARQKGHNRRPKEPTRTPTGEPA